MSIVFDGSQCVGCGVCMEACPNGAFDVNGGSNYSVMFKQNKCQDCPDCKVPESCLGECVRRT